MSKTMRIMQKYSHYYKEITVSKYWQFETKVKRSYRSKRNEKTRQEEIRNVFCLLTVRLPKMLQSLTRAILYRELRERSDK